MNCALPNFPPRRLFQTILCFRNVLPKRNFERTEQAQQQNGQNQQNQPVLFQKGRCLAKKKAVINVPTTLAAGTGCLSGALFITPCVVNARCPVSA